MKKHVFVITLSLFISALHYLTPTHFHHLHAIFQRLYYIPIILAAYYFNLKHAIAYAVFCGLLYAPHIFFQWAYNATHSFTQYVEISMFLVIAFILGVLFDIRRRHQVQIMLQQEELAREKRLGLLGKLAAGLAHEIRNPLGGLIGSAEILKDDLGEGHPKAEFVKIIEKELRRVNKKLNEFMDFARPRMPEFIPNNVNDIVSEVVLLLQSDSEKAGITIEKGFQQDMPLVPMDAEQIKQIILNVVLNSLKALTDGGELKIKTEYTGREVVLSFKDNGPGIPENEIETVFEPFFTKKEKGTGLGLAVSRQLAEAHRGSLKAVRQDKGACFELRLPDGA
ncbi:nitrogen regulation protein NR(II) [Fibrobacterota bacterium]